MQLTDWLMLLRSRHAWPPNAQPVRFPTHAMLSGRPSSDGRTIGGDARHNAPWRFRIPTRRLTVGVRRDPSRQTVT